MPPGFRDFHNSLETDRLLIFGGSPAAGCPPEPPTIPEGSIVRDYTGLPHLEHLMDQELDAGPGIAGEPEIPMGAGSGQGVADPAGHEDDGLGDLTGSRDASMGEEQPNGPNLLAENETWYSQNHDLFNEPL